MEHPRKRKSTRAAVRSPQPLPLQPGDIQYVGGRKWTVYDVLNMYYLIIQTEDTDFAIVAKALRTHDYNQCKTRFQNDQKQFYQDKPSPAAAAVFYSIAMDFLQFAQGLATLPPLLIEFKRGLLTLLEELAEQLRNSQSDKPTMTPYWRLWIKRVRDIYPRDFLPNLGYPGLKTKE